MATALFMLYLAGHLFRWIGKWFKGEAETGQTRAVYAWSCIPEIVAALFSLPVVFILGNQVFACHLPNIAPASPMGIYQLTTSLLSLIGGIWGLVVMVVCLSEVLRITKVKALVSAIIGSLILAAFSFLGEFIWALQNY